MIKFTEQDHLYTSIVPDDRKWLSATTLISSMHEKFDSRAAAVKSSTRRPTQKYPNKWFNLPVYEIEAAWKAEGLRSTDLGTWYHNKRENKLYDTPGLTVFKPVIEGTAKLAPNQVLTEGIYPEHLVYLASAEVCGQSDYVEVKNNKVYIRDYKTSKEIKRVGFTNWGGVVKKMLPPVAHLDDCHFYHYALQLSLYMYIILRHNPTMVPGTLIIEHVKFEVAGEDKYSYPIYAQDEHGEYIVTEIEEIELPYLAKEIQTILNWLKTNKSKLHK
jgi:hypothetical protein